MHEELVNSIAEKISSEIKDVIVRTVQESVEQEVARALQKALSDSEFYRGMNLDVQTGLNTIYKEILHLKKETGSLNLPQVDETEKLFDRATHKLDSIIKTTENATFEIMDIIEAQMQEAAEFEKKMQSVAGDVMHKEDVYEFMEKMNADFLKIMTALSFQDITGQHIKRIIEFIKRIEEIVGQLYISSNLMIRAREQHPDKDAREIREEAEKTISQGDVDALLREMGLE